MFELIPSPDWFQGIDILFEGISLLVALAIAFFSWRIFSIQNDSKYAWFSFAFFLIAASLGAKLVTHGLLYSDSLRITAQGVLGPVVGKTNGLVNYADLFFRFGFFAHMVTMLGGWLLLFFLSQRKGNRLKNYYEVSQIALFVYLVSLISFVANFKYFVFYLTAAVILGLTVLNYYKNYLNANRSHASFMVLIAFMLLLLSNLAFIFVFLHKALYMVGEVFLLFGFLVLLYVYVRVTR